MRVVVVCLRFEGRKRTREELERAKPMVGNLFVERVDGSVHARLERTNDYGLALPPEHLFDCSMTRMDDDGFLLVGQEKVASHWRTERQAQAWWCRLPGARSLVSAPAPRPAVTA